LASVWVAATGAGCGEDEPPDRFCCALEKLCSACECEFNPELRTIANSEDEDACRFALEDNEYGCTDLGETDALSFCVTPPSD
jgi:hypothetical protein